MKLNTNSNSYIIIYSAVLVVIVAFLLAFVYQALKPMQDANVALDVKKQILYSLNICDLDGAEAEAKYAEVVKNEGEIDGQKYYSCEINGENILVVSMKGMGLWGGISGYISIHGDKEPVVYGAYFNHESETAGLGASYAFLFRRCVFYPLRARTLDHRRGRAAGRVPGSGMFYRCRDLDRPDHHSSYPVKR